MKHYELSDWNDMDDIPCNPSLISVCCSAPPLGETYDAPDCPPTGICSVCRDHTTFEQNSEE